MLNLKLQPNKFHSQMKSAGNATRAVLQAMFGLGKPADRVLSAWFRNTHKCGSRDRQFIGGTVYALLRYWGILRKFLPIEQLQEIEKGNISLGRIELDALLFGALYLDYQDLTSADLLAKELGFPWPKLDKQMDDQLIARALGLSKLFGIDADFSRSDLLPSWIEKHLPTEIDRKSFLADLVQRPPMWIRLQTDETDRLIAELRGAGLSASPHSRIPAAIAVSGRVNLYTLESFKKGLFEVQDLASQCIGLVASPNPGERWWDACAGAGGKTLQLASLMKRTGTVVASDIREYKLADLRLRARRAGFPNIHLTQWNGKPRYGKHATQYDGVLVDAPCSGSGVWRRNPDGRWTLKEAELTEITRTQLEILKATAPSVKSGGVLVYATCSLLPDENSAVLEQFLSQNPEYHLEDFPNPLNGNTTEGKLQVFSYDGNCDCMFVARMRRRKEPNHATL